MTPLTIQSTPFAHRAIAATAELLGRQKMESAFVGNVARSAWLGELVETGPVDVIALMKPEQKNQLCMMAGNRGFRVEKDEVMAAEELDLIPMHHLDPDGESRVHILLASNALYGKMVNEARIAMMNDLELRVPSAEDLALLLTMAGDEVARHRLTSRTEFDRTGFNTKLVSIGLSRSVVSE